MNSKTESKNCQNCSQNFTIEEEDFNFYEKIKVPPPRLCPECRQRRRYVWRNERVLYRRNCDLCSKSAVSIFSPQKPYKAYCNDCWWGDGWDPTSYGRDFDFNRPFFEQFNELLLATPRQSLLIKNSVGSEYTHHSIDNKNCYYSFSIIGCENVLYSTNVYTPLKDSSDCYHVNGTSNERNYECIDLINGYKCQYSFLLRDCTDCYYSYDLRNCSNCFLSANLRNKSYCILNEQYTKEEYEQKIKEFNLGSRAARAKLYDAFLEMMEDKAMHKFASIQQSINSSGNFVSNAKNSKMVFDADHLENCKYMIVAPDVKDSMDAYHIGFKTELIYEIHAVIRSSNVAFANLSYDNTGIQYCDSCHNSSNLFGCIGIRKGKNMLFNKQYTEEGFKVMRDKIIEHMKKMGEYGEFFPSSLSPFGYNETQGQIYMPLTKEEALKMGFKWEDSTGGVYGKETIGFDKIPDDISEVADSITKEALRCENCTKNYNIVPQELQFYKREVIPIPTLCPDCRYKRRIEMRSPRKLWYGSCKCEKENHGHSGKCPNEFETSYSPERTETIYCESCYNKEVY